MKCTCANCGKEFARTLSRAARARGGNLFCSRSCSNSFNNRANPKRKVEGSCKNCRTGISASLTYCKPCYRQKFTIDWSTVTLDQVVGARRYQKHSRIRDLARRLFLSSDRPYICQNCSYDKHIEVCHIKPIKDFDLSSMVSEINHLDNLLGLCPNCHWELDHGDLTLEEITKGCCSIH